MAHQLPEADRTGQQIVSGSASGPKVTEANPLQCIRVEEISRQVKTPSAVVPAAYSVSAALFSTGKSEIRCQFIILARKAELTPDSPPDFPP